MADLPRRFLYSTRSGQARPWPLSRKLALIIALKILFLTAFWQLVLKHQATHITTSRMGDLLVAPTPQGH